MRASYVPKAPFLGTRGQSRRASFLPSVSSGEPKSRNRSPETSGGEAAALALERLHLARQSLSFGRTPAAVPFMGLTAGILTLAGNPAANDRRPGADAAACGFSALQLRQTRARLLGEMALGTPLP